VVIIFELYHHMFLKFERLKESRILIFPSEFAFTISTTGKPQIKIHHRQLLLTSAHDFTDQKAQDDKGRAFYWYMWI
jgi:hypothetical protein